MMTSNKQVSAQVSGILPQAVEWHLIALLWGAPRQLYLAQLGCLSSQIDDPLLKEVAGLAAETTQEDYLMHFGPDGPIPLEETAYINGRERQEILSRIKIAHEAFSFQSLIANPADHIAVQADFISHLYVKEARARIANDEQSAAEAVDLRKRFVQEHLAPLVNNVSCKMSGSVPTIFLKLLVATRYKLQTAELSDHF